MLKICKQQKLKKLLEKLKIPINNNFDFSKMGYFNVDDTKAAIKYAREKNIFYNALNNKEIILSNKEISLGKSEITFKNDIVKIEYYSNQEYQKIEKIYEKIKHLKAVPKLIFDEKFLYQEYIEGNKLLDSKPKNTHKNLLIEFIKDINKLGFAHRDMHCKNILISEKNLSVIDWDFVTWQECDLLNAYDITGHGLPSPHLTYNTHIFKRYEKINIPSVADILGIKLSNFF